jgi:hypothetical protein
MVSREDATTHNDKLIRQEFTNINPIMNLPELSSISILHHQSTLWQLIKTET